MKISDQAIDNPRTVTVLTILVLLLALFASVFTPVQLSPAITKAVVIVAIPYPDSRPSEAENEIARKVEDALRDLKSVDFMNSSSLRGSSITQVTFLDGVEPDDARREVKDLVDRIRNELPTGREVQPIVTDVDFENLPLMLVNLTAPRGFDERELKTIAEGIQDELETVDGVSNTQLFGGKERELHVNINPDLMTEYGLSLADVRQALSDFHAEVPAGEFSNGSFEPSIRNETKLRGVDDIRAAIVSRRGDGRVLSVNDIAEVIDTSRKPLSGAEFDERRGMLLIINKEADINTLGATRAVKAKVAELQERFPTISFDTARDASGEIWVMFRVLGSSALFGAMLVLVILAWTMGLRISILVLLAIPFSMAVALVFLFLAGIAVSNMVIFSFILVLGMVVDGAIIVAENIHRHIERGEEPIDAAKVGIAEVGLPVIAADLTTVAAFLPMLLVPGIMGDFMGVMPKVVSVALLGSVLVDHFIIPTLAARWYRRRDPKRDESRAFAALSGTHKGVSSESAPPQAMINPNINLLTKLYAWSLRFALSSRLFVMAWCLLAVWGAMTLYGQLGFKFFPASDRGQFVIDFELPLGYSLDETLAASRVITDSLKVWQENGVVTHYVTSVGTSSALAMRVDDDPAAGPEFGQVQVEMVPPMDRNVHSEEVMQYLRENIQPVPGMKYSIEPVEDGPPGGADVAVRITGKNLDQLGATAQQIVDRLKGTSGVFDPRTDFRPNSPELVIEPRPEIVGQFGMTELQIAQAVQTAIAGDNRIQITLDDEEVTLRIQLADEYRRHPEEIKRLMAGGADGQMTAIGELASIRRDTGLYSINRYDRNRAVVAKCDVSDPVQPADVFKLLSEEILPDLGFQPLSGAEQGLEGYSKQFVGKPTTQVDGLQIEFAGENDERDKNFGYLLNSMGLAVVLIAAILVWQFNSFRQSCVVMLTVPLSFIGVVIGMWAAGFPFSLASFIGLVSLTGIVVNDAIVLVDFTNQARKRGLSVREAIVEAGVNRFRPVMLTTITTIGGLLPLLLNISGGAEFWQPLTGAVVFGLAFASVLTLVVIPCAYSLYYTRFTASEWTIALPALLAVVAAFGAHLYVTMDWFEPAPGTWVHPVFYFGGFVALLLASVLLTSKEKLATA